LISVGLGMTSGKDGDEAGAPELLVVELEQD
jgi:hypothetical protein